MPDIHRQGFNVGHKTGDRPTSYYYAGSTRIAMRLKNLYSEQVYYFFSDHLGSTNVMTEGNGNVVTELMYKAWGEVRYSSGSSPTDFTYTGQRSEMDDIGLMFYNARFYDPQLGRFAQADTIVPGAGNPGAYDRYAYVVNSPIRFNDPIGSCAFDTNYLFDPIGSAITCFEDLKYAFQAFLDGDHRYLAFEARATGLENALPKINTRIRELNIHIDTVFSNETIEKRIPAAIDVGWTSVSTSANLLGFLQLSRGISALCRIGSGGSEYAVEGTIQTITLGEGDTLYRVYGSSSKQIGLWATTRNPGNQINAIQKLALPPNNSANFLTTIELSGIKNAELSIASSLFGQPGGATQIRFADLNNLIFSNTKSLPVGVMPFAPTNIFSLLNYKE